MSKDYFRLQFPKSSHMLVITANRLYERLCVNTDRYEHLQRLDTLSDNLYKDCLNLYPSLKNIVELVFKECSYLIPDDKLDTVFYKFIIHLKNEQ